ncbi:MAG: DUF1624 domain-containing protein [Clostridiales bacterium]|nr:DUF1624 domain-containing protein [Clostridiales bacterium]
MGSYFLSFLGIGKTKKDRAFELDLLRGIAIIMMMFMHFSFDVRYEFGIDAFSYLRTSWFWVFVHPVILVLFVGVSGICCSFSRNNFKRGFSLLSIALAFTLVTALITSILDISCLIIFNVLHLLSISMLLYAVLDAAFKKAGLSYNAISLITGILGIYIITLADKIDMLDGCTSNMIFYPVGFEINGSPNVADYMYIVPWMGVFFVGTALGRSLYKDKKSLFPSAGGAARKITAPFEFLGRHSLIIYLGHQPIIYGLLFIIFKLTGKI